jgi:putative membrane-bound dehydrogenase-like protein
MTFFYSSRAQWVMLLAVTLTVSCNRKTAKDQEPPLIVREDPSKGALVAEEIRKNTAVQLADGLKISLWATDSLAPDPIAMSIDDQGRVYLTRTNRQKNSEFDIRGHRDWMTPSIGLQTVEDRRTFLKQTFAAERSKENEWLPDLNKDSIHDWQDLAVEKDEVWKIEDENGDGLADVSTRILSDFHEEITDVAGALLVREEDVFVGIGPDMWRLKDTNGDGVLDEKESISHGYAVHIGFSGHGMSGAIEGPDGKIYWGIGDIGANLVDKEGKKHEYPNEGIIVRSNPDGSDFEIVAHGLRNTHEFVFDEYGNIITSDNDGDHPGESERLVHIVEGLDAGWRANWQYGKYTDPKNNTYKVWMDEKLYIPRWEGQAAYIIPPIRNYHNGPTGMVYNPGTALGSAWKNKFFLVEFVGNPSRSHIWSFGLKPKGASFDFDSEVDVLSGILPTGIKFGPDGALYVADWINGWGTKNYGRVWRIDVAEGRDDLKAAREETKRLIQLDYKDQNEDDLFNLLQYEDMRVRQKAQFELVKRGDEGLETFNKAIAQKDNQLARIHAIWGIGQLAREDKSLAKNLTTLLEDSDPEIIAQSAKILGDVRYTEAGDQLLPLLASEYPRTKFFAAQALGRIGFERAIDPLLEMIEKNQDEDVYIRHAGVFALARIGKTDPIIALAGHENRSLRIAAVLVLRRLKNENVALFLKDSDEYIVTEAARAINDDLSIEKALPALAATLNEKRFTSEPLLRRAINACLRVGSDTELNTLLAFAERNDIAPGLRAEALAAIGTWPSPSVMDRVDGRYRGKIERDPAPVLAKVQPHAGKFLQSKDASVLVAASQMIGSLGITNYNADLKKLMQQHSSPAVRSAMLTALHQLKVEDMEAVIKQGMADRDATVRTAALGLLNELETTRESLPGIVDPIFKKGTVKEQQQLLSVLGRMPVEKTETVLNNLVKELEGGKFPPEITLDLIEAVNETKNEQLISRVSSLRPAGTTTASFSETLYGGDARAGGWIFMTNSTAQCVRCHAIRGEGGTVGPDLSSIGSVLSREQLLEALVEPSKRLAPGYGSVTVTLNDGQSVTGILMEESGQELLIKTSDAEPMRVPVSRITKRENMPSGMPPMGTLLSRREIRNIVEFLSVLKGEEKTEEGHGE